jgi:CRP-like cAMP-binding protein
MDYEIFKENQTIFEQGSIGTKFFVILKGSVGVIVNIPKISEEKLSNGTILAKTDFIPTEVKVLRAGDSFGELALIDNKPRAATIICKEDTHLAVLDQKHFNNILSRFLFSHLIFKLFFILKRG